MKSRFLYFLLVSALFTVTSCIKNDPITVAEPVVEFDATVLNTPLTGKTYPVLTRVPGYGAAVTTTNPSVTRASGTIKFRVNLVGRQQTSDQEIKYKVVTAPTLPAGVAEAVAGTHFSVTGTFTIPANSSFGELVVNVINPGTPSTTPVGLVLELEGGSNAKPSENYKLLGIQISQN